MQLTYVPTCEESNLGTEETLLTGASDEMAHLACVSRFISRGAFFTMEQTWICFSFQKISSGF